MKKSPIASPFPTRNRRRVICRDMPTNPSSRPRRHGAQRSGARRREGHDPAPARADGRRRGPLPTFQVIAATDPLYRRVVDQMLVGVARRPYTRSLEPLGPEMKSRGTSSTKGLPPSAASSITQLTSAHHVRLIVDVRARQVPLS